MLHNKFEGGGGDKRTVFSLFKTSKNKFLYPLFITYVHQSCYLLPNPVKNSKCVHRNIRFKGLRF